MRAATRSWSVLLLSLLFLAPSQAETAPWTAIGPDGGVVTTLVVHPRRPNVLYAGTRAAGVYTSRDGGRSWQARRSGLLDNHILSLAGSAANPEEVYAGTSRDGVWKSTSGGETWRSANAGLPTPVRGVQAVAVDPSEPRRVYIAYGGELFRSTNGGASWSRGGGVPRSVRALVIDPRQPRNVYAGTATQGIFKSTNFGASWTRVSRGLPALGVTVLAVAPSSPRTLYAILEGNTQRVVFRTDDGGATWRPASGGLPANRLLQALAVDPESPRTVYLGTYLAGIFKSTDGGRSWQPRSPGPALASVTALAVHPANPAILWAGTGLDETRAGGVYRSGNGGDTWRRSSQGLTATFVYRLTAGPGSGTAVPASLYAVTGLPGVAWASRSGAPWVLANRGLPAGNYFELAASPFIPGLVFAGTSEGVFRSTDGGANWEPASAGIVPHDQFDDRGITAIGFHATDPDVIYAAGLEWIYTSTDRGETWRRTGVGINTHFESFAASPADPDVVYAAGMGMFDDDASPGQLYRSKDAGETWEALDLRGALQVAADPSAAGTLLVASRRRGIFRSTDGGQSFDRVDLPALPLPVDVQAVAFDPTSPGTVYAMGRYADAQALVLRSEDGGLSWEVLDLGPIPRYAEFFDLAVDADGSVYLATRGSGVFRLRAE